MAVYRYLYQRITLPRKSLVEDRRRLGTKSITDENLATILVTGNNSATIAGVIERISYLCRHLGWHFRI
jgi:hypothetical protein